MTNCLGCFKPVEQTSTVHTYSVGGYPKREVAQVRYCKKCHDNLMAELRPAARPTPGIPSAAGSVSPDFYKERVKELESRGLSDAEICAELDRTINIGNMVILAVGGAS